MIKWTGRSTNGIWRKKEKAKNFIKLYNLCCENGTVNTDYDIYDETLLKKNNKTWKDFEDEEEDIDWFAFEQWKNEAIQLTDKELWSLITNETGNAFYQTFQIEKTENGLTLLEVILMKTEI